jgi:hypothetical protein
VHLETTKAKPVSPRATATAELPQASVLCPYADSHDYTCTLNVPAKTGVRVIGCDAKRADVEIFTQRGLYLHGFINASQLPNACGGR